MSTTTTNYKLTKPAYADTVDIAVLNSNFDTIDSTLKTLTDNKLATNNIANNLSTTAAGYVLDARQGKALQDEIDTLSDGKVDETSIANNLTTTTAGYVLDARQGKALQDEIATLSDGKVDKTSLTYGTEDLTPGESALATGTFYFVYE